MGIRLEPPAGAVPTPTRPRFALLCVQRAGQPGRGALRTAGTPGPPGSRSWQGLKDQRLPMLPNALEKLNGGCQQ